MICRLFLFAISGAILVPLLWRYVWLHESVVSEGTRKRLSHEQASADLIREQAEMPRGRRTEKVQGPTSRYDRGFRR